MSAPFRTIALTYLREYKGAMQTIYNSAQGPVERFNNRLVLRIPLDAGGDKLHLVARANSFVEGRNLVVLLPDWLAHRMHLVEGTEVYLDDRWGKLNIARVH